MSPLPPSSSPAAPRQPANKKRTAKRLMVGAGMCFALGILIQVFLSPRWTEQAPIQAPTAEHRLPTVPVVLKGVVFDTEMAVSVQEQMQGLMGREHLGDEEAMVFVGTQPGPRTFWMKNTLIPLDILFFDQNWRLVGMHENVPPCTADPCPRYHSPPTSMHVLELRAGRAGELGVAQGDALSFPEGQPWLQ